MTRRAVTALGWCACVLASGSLSAQAAPAVAPAPEAIRVFLDCQTHCDFEYARREITYVNWVRDRQDADVHLIIRSQGTGGGGAEFTLQFIGRRAFEGRDDELTFTTRQSDTGDEIRIRQIQRIGLGLARYVARSVFADRLRLGFSAPEGAVAAPTQQPRDPWNLWVFPLGANGHIVSESQFRSTNIQGNFRARRVTEQWKLSASIRGNRSTSRYTLEDSSVVRSKRSDYTLALLGVRSPGRALVVRPQCRGSSLQQGQLRLAGSLRARDRVRRLSS